TSSRPASCACPSARRARSLPRRGSRRPIPRAPRSPHRAAEPEVRPSVPALQASHERLGVPGLEIEPRHEPLPAPAPRRDPRPGLIARDLREGGRRADAVARDRRDPNAARLVVRYLGGAVVGEWDRRVPALRREALAPEDGALPG